LRQGSRDDAPLPQSLLEPVPGIVVTDDDTLVWPHGYIFGRQETGELTLICTKLNQFSFAVTKERLLEIALYAEKLIV
jgi:hypothetical protein